MVDKLPAEITQGRGGVFVAGTTSALTMKHDQSPTRLHDGLEYPAEGRTSPDRRETACVVERAGIRHPCSPLTLRRILRAGRKLDSKEL